MMGTLDFYVDYETEGPYFTDDLKEQLEARLWELARDHTDMVGAAVAVTTPVKNSETPFLFQVRIVVYISPEDIVAVKQDDTVQGALNSALSAIERQVREKREKLGEPWKRHDIPGNPN
jgi:ribosome-associated translation inhibitor RaiA